MIVWKKSEKKPLPFKISKIILFSILGIFLFSLFVFFMVDLLHYRIKETKQNINLPFEKGELLKKEDPLEKFEVTNKGSKINIDYKSTNVLINKNGIIFETIPYNYFDKLEAGIPVEDRKYNLFDYKKDNENINKYRAPLNCTYIYRGLDKPAGDLNGYDYSVKNGEYRIYRLKNGFRVEYEMTTPLDHTWIPVVIPREEYEKIYEENPSYQVALEQVYNYNKNRNTARMNFGSDLTYVEELHEMWVDNYNLTDEELVRRVKKWAPNSGMIKKATFTIPVEYKLTEKGDLDVCVLTDKIVEKTVNLGSKTFHLCDIELLPYLVKTKYTNAKDNAFLFVPDGCGALIKPSEQKFKTKYTVDFYNNTFFHNSNLSENKLEQQNLMPFIAAAEEGEGVLADIKSGFSFAKATYKKEKDLYVSKLNFRLKDFDKYEFVKGEKITSYEKLNQKERINVRYHFVNKPTGVEYFDFVKILQNEYFKNAAVNKESLKLELEVIGAFLSKEHALGIPYNDLKKLTTYEEFFKIKKLYEAYDILYKYSGFSKGGINGTTHEKIKREKELGSKNIFKKLLNEDIYFDSYLIEHYKEKEGHFKNKRHGVRIFGGNSKTFKYFNRRDLTRDLLNDENKFYLLAPNYFNDYSKKYSKNNNEFKSLAFRDLGSQFLKNYTFKPYGGDQTIIDQVNFVKNNNFNIMLKNAFFHVARYAKNLEDMPLTSSRDISYYSDIPFLQLLYGPYISLYSDSINLDETADYNYVVLKSLLSKSSVKYTVSYRDTSVSKNSKYFNKIYGTNIFNQALKEKIQKSYDMIKSFENETKSLKLTNHQILIKDVYLVEYQTKKFVFNLSGKTYNYLGQGISSIDYRKV